MAREQETMPIKHKNCDNGYVRPGQKCKENDCELCDWNNCPMCNGTGQRMKRSGTWVVCSCQKKNGKNKTGSGIPDTISERYGE